MNQGTGFSPEKVRCARCGASFSCGPEKGETRCWCTGSPQVMPVPELGLSAEALAKAGTGCWCPECLERITAARGAEETT